MSAEFDDDNELENEAERELLKQKRDAFKLTALAPKTTQDELDRAKAAEDLSAGMLASHLSGRKFAARMNRDESILRDWFSKGRKEIPLRALYRLPVEGQIEVLLRIARRLPPEERRALLSRLFEAIRGSESGEFRALGTGTLGA